MSKESKMTGKRWAAIFARWSSIIAMIIATVFIMYIADQMFGLKLLLKKLSCWEWVCFSFACALILSLPPFNFSFTVKSLSRRGSWSYPPASFAVYISLFVAITAMVGKVYFDSIHIGFKEKTFTLSVIYLGILFGSLIREGYQKFISFLHRKAEPETLNIKSQAKKGVKCEGGAWTIDNWLKSDTRVSCAADDKLGFDKLVDKIVNEIGINSHFALGIEGVHGSGKSSLTTLVEEKMLNVDPRFVFVRLDSWGMSGEGAVDTVLREIIRALESEGVDCLAIRKLPEDYFKAIDGAHKSGVLFTSLIKDAMTTKSVMLRLDRILKATSYRIILCLEDIDRSDESVMQNITPLLDRFRRYTETVSFIFELTHREEYRIFDHIRLFDFVEQMPELPRRKVWGVFLQLFDKIKGQYEDDVWILGAYDMHFYDNGTDDFHRLTPKQAMLDIVSTPRALKRVLRKIWYSWGSLHGEVDFIELTMMSSLQICKPAVYNFLKQNMSKLWALSEKTGSAERGKMRKPLLEVWNKIDFVSNNERENIERMLSGLGMPLFDENYSIGMREIPQGIFSDNGSDYWERITKGHLTAGDISDQKALLLFKQLHEVGFTRDAFKEIDHDSRFAYKIKQFRYKSGIEFVENFFEPERLLSFFASYNDFLLERDGVDVDIYSNYSLSVLRSIIAGSPRSCIPVEWLMKELKKAVGQSLSMAIGIIKAYSEYVFGEIPRGESDEIMLNGEKVTVSDCELLNREQLATLFRMELVKEFTRQFKLGEVNLKAILPQRPFENKEKLYVLTWLMIWDRKKNTFGANYWRFLASDLVSLIEDAPSVYFPQLFHVLFLQSELSSGKLDEFSAQYFEELFVESEHRSTIAKALIDYPGTEGNKESQLITESIAGARDILVSYIQ